MPFEIKPGTEIAFLNGDDERAVGIVNGEPLVFDDRTLIPVYIHDGDRCIAVDARNIV